MKKIILTLILATLLFASCGQNEVQDKNNLNKNKVVTQKNENSTVVNKSNLYFSEGSIIVEKDKSTSVDLYIDTNGESITTIFIPFVYDKSELTLDTKINEDEFDMIVKNDKSSKGRVVSISNTKGGIKGDKIKVLSLDIKSNTEEKTRIYIDEDYLSVLNPDNTELKMDKRIQLEITTK